MEHSTNETPERLPLPVWAWLLFGGLIAAVIAVFIFSVPLKTVGTWGLIAVLVGSHFFIHGSHGGHGAATGHAGHSDHHNQGVAASQDSPMDGPQEDKETSPDSGESHHGCC